MPESDSIEVTVELYGMWRDIGGAKRAVLSLPSGCTLTDLVVRLGARSGEDFQKLLINPATGELWSSFAIAVNNALIERAAEMCRELQANDLVSFFHPVAGG
jgi:molybdopterin converting factor small subunit